MSATDRAFLGRRRAQERRNNELPIALSATSAMDVRRICFAIDHALEHGLDEPMAAAAAAVALMLISGRDLEELCCLRFFSGRLDDARDRSGHWLIHYGQGYALAMPAGASPTKAQPNAAASKLVLPPSDQVIFKLGERAARCLKVYIGSDWDRSGTPALWKEQRPVFSYSLGKLEELVDTFLRQAGTAYGISRRSRIVDPKRIERALETGLVNLKGSDRGMARLLTGGKQPARQAAAYYSGGTEPHITQEHERACTQASVDTFDDCVLDYFQSDVELSLGSRFIPTTAAVEGLRDKLIDEIRFCKPAREPRQVASVHNAMLTYSWMLWSLCVGGRRVKDPILHPRQIDPGTGFGLFRDKGYTPAATVALLKETTAFRDNLESYKLRLVWAPGIVQRQLQAYCDHIEALLTDPRLPERSQKSIKRWRDEDEHRLPFFRLDRHLQAKRLGAGQFEKMLAGDPWYWPLPMNALRHYLRAELCGRVSHEVVDALLGHWQIGAEPWWNGGALDPLLFKESLKAAFRAILPEGCGGWAVQSGLSNRLDIHDEK
ncbi:hypothetical protein [Sphingomonas sp. ID1715]|uniref:hypothetical protein n=1 Tax=Sphingomonas sp. ID1715 TaxID=1656898 RepID=UPI00148784E7|nr:hypothetical protein [Sphingomonas sp. ID1715]